MPKACALLMLAAMLWGCAGPTTAWKGRVEWPDAQSRRNVVPFMEAGAALAAAAAIQEMVKENPHPDLFSGCSSPGQGLDVAVFTGPTEGVYYVLVDQRFDRCGGPSVRVLDGWYEYAVSPQGTVLGKAPPASAEDTFVPSSPPPGPEPALPPSISPPAPGAEPPAPPSSPEPLPAGGELSPAEPCLQQDCAAPPGRP